MLKGLSGSVKVDGKLYNKNGDGAVMPGLGENKTFTDEDLAAIATYIRQAWSNSASEVKISTFKEVRSETKIKVNTYTVKELEKAFPQ